MHTLRAVSSQRRYGPSTSTLNLAEKEVFYIEPSEDGCQVKWR